MDKVTKLARSAANLISEYEAMNDAVEVISDREEAIRDELTAVEVAAADATAQTAEGAAFQLQILGCELDSLLSWMAELNKNDSRVSRINRLLASAEGFLRDQAASPSLEVSHGYYGPSATTIVGNAQLADSQMRLSASFAN